LRIEADPRIRKYHQKPGGATTRTDRGILTPKFDLIEIEPHISSTIFWARLRTVSIWAHRLEPRFIHGFPGDFNCPPESLSDKVKQIIDNASSAMRKAPQ